MGIQGFPVLPGDGGTTSPLTSTQPKKSSATRVTWAGRERRLVPTDRRQIDLAPLHHSLRYPPSPSPLAPFPQRQPRVVQERDDHHVARHPYICNFACHKCHLLIE